MGAAANNGGLFWCKSNKVDLKVSASIYDWSPLKIGFTHRTVTP